MMLTMIFVLLVAVIIAIVWVKGINTMHEKHPDYKGLDLFDEEEVYNDEPVKQERKSRKKS